MRPGSIDETRASANMARKYGRGPGGQRLVGAVPHGHRKATAFVAALRAGGMTAPVVIDGAMTGDLFVAYVGQVPAPTPRPGDAVVMGNPAAHERAGVGEAIERAGCALLYLPPYGPDFDPIELASSELESLLRKAGERTVDGLWEFLGRSLDAFAPQVCRNYMRHRGYTATQQ
jgi:transposase